METSDRVAAGQAVYTPITLKIYDWLVLGISNRFLWRCPTAELEAMYDRNVSDNHLDIGVGTGYFLDKAKWPVANPRITLVDLNPHSLVAASNRIVRYSPSTVAANVFEPLPVQLKFDSVSMSYLLHCLPGKMSEKAPVVFDHVLNVMAPGAKVFGATILQGDRPRSRPAQIVMNFYNRKGVFSNQNDTAPELECALREKFNEVKIAHRGVVAVFEARNA